MKRVFNIQIQRADNGFIAIAQSDTPGVKSKKIVAVDEAGIKTAAKDLVDHMFDEPPAEKPAPAPTPAKA